MKSAYAVAICACALTLPAAVVGPRVDAAPRPQITIGRARVNPTRVKGSGRVSLTVRVTAQNTTVTSVTARVTLGSPAISGPAANLSALAASDYSGSLSVPFNNTAKAVRAAVSVTVNYTGGGPITKTVARVLVEPGGDPNQPPPPPDI